MDRHFALQAKKILENDYQNNIDLFVDDLKHSIEGLKNKSANNSNDNLPAIIEIEALNKSYKVGTNTISALKNATLKIGEGEMVAIVGPSGSGKSTLLQMIGALDKPTDGKIIVSGQDTSKLNDKQMSIFRNRTIGFVFQSFYLQSYLNIAQNLEIPMIFGGVKRSERQAAIEMIAESIGLADRIHHLPKQLSGGQMQRVAIGRAIINNPRIILADEPTANLDKEKTIEIMELFVKINKERGTTVIVVTHNDLVASYCDRTIHISDGEIVS